MATLEQRPDPDRALARVRIINPGPRSEQFAIAYDLDIDGIRLHPTWFEVCFDPAGTPVITLSLPAVIETGEAPLAFPECREEC